MKILFNKQLALADGTQLPEGRHVATVIQIVGVGDQPAYTIGDPPVPSVGVVVQLAGSQIAKKMRLSDSPLSALFGFLDAALPNPDLYDGDDPLPLTLGRPVAIEISVNGKRSRIESFHRPEDFEVAAAPKVATGDLVLLDDVEALQGEAGKALFLKLHRDIRRWCSARVRG